MSLYIYLRHPFICIYVISLICSKQWWISNTTRAYPFNFLVLCFFCFHTVSVYKDHPDFANRHWKKQYLRVELIPVLPIVYESNKALVNTCLDSCMHAHLLFILYKFVNSILAITFLLLVFFNWNFHDVCQCFLYNQEQNFSCIRQKMINFP